MTPMWYAIPLGGEEQGFLTPFLAHLHLNQLGVEGDIELETQAGRDVVAHRDADGVWTTP